MGVKDWRKKVRKVDQFELVNVRRCLWALVDSVEECVDKKGQKAVAARFAALTGSPKRVKKQTAYAECEHAWEEEEIRGSGESCFFCTKCNEKLVM